MMNNLFMNSLGMVVKIDQKSLLFKRLKSQSHTPLSELEHFSSYLYDFDGFFIPSAEIRDGQNKIGIDIFSVTNLSLKM